MSWIEGIGDEVLFFILAAFVIIALTILAWKSTEVPDPRPLSIRLLSSQEVQQMLNQNNSSRPDREENARASSSTTAQSIPDVLIVRRESNETSQTPEIPEEESPPSSEPDPPTIENEAGESLSSERESQAEVSEEQEGEAISTVRQRLRRKSVGPTIKIRLKFIDDTQKMIETSTEQTLLEFKMHYFERELNANKTVKLIFNARVLEDDNMSLSQLGLDDNCVVHCLVINRPSTSTPATVRQNNSGTAQGRAPPHISTDSPFISEGVSATQSPPGAIPQQIEAGIDVGGLLVPLFGVVLGLVWYCRIAYATYFTTAATIALVGLSGLCLVSFFIACFPVR